MRTRTLWCGLLVLALAGGVAFGQGVQTGTLRGKVVGPNGEPLPGVTVTVDSPALQGTRAVTTVGNGEYLFRALPKGDYTVTFALESMVTVQRSATLEVGQISRVDAELRVATVEEKIVVQGETPNPLQTTEITYNVPQETVDELAVTRDLDAIADLAPGLTLNTPNADQVSINGAFAYDSVWLMDGVEINDNIFNSFDDLFIEDALLETQVLTSGVSAEYGRFSGGVVNVLTKSGGNQFSGSLRVDFTNPDWQERSPFEKENDIQRTDQTNDVWQATAGGRILRDRLWFFAAGRTRESTDADPFDVTGLQFNQETDNERYEIKLTGNIGDRHTLQGVYTENDLTQLRKNFAFTIDPVTVFTQETPQDLRVLRYNGILSDDLFLDLQYSEKKSHATRGGDAVDLVDSPFISFGFSRPVGVQHYNGTYFDARDPEDRDNEQLAGSLSYFLASDQAGSHDLKFGIEDFTNINVGGNSQSPTGLVFLCDYELGPDGSVPFDAEGRLMPVFEICFLNEWIPERGSRLEINTRSFYVNDRWNLNDHWSFNIGFRYEEVDSEATGDIVAVDTDRIVPRLGASYDLKGNGRYKIDATYAQYSGGYPINTLNSNSGVSNPSLIQYFYIGPPGSGRDFAPGFDLNNWFPVFARFPSVNVGFEDDMKSPVTDEITLSFGMQLPRSGYFKATYVDRDMDDIIEDFILFELGRTEITDPILLTVDNQEFRNTNLADRTYEAVQLQGRYNITQNWTVQGNYTYQIENDGNFVGEARNQPAIPSDIGDQPEFYNPDRNFPLGRLPGFQEHKVRLWSAYNFDLGRAGDLNLGLLYNFDSATPYSLVHNNFPLTAEQAAQDPGYANPPSTTNVFFGERGSALFNDLHIFDFAVNYSIPVAQRFEPWIKVEVFNLFNNDDLVTFDTEVRGNTAGPVDELGLPTTFTRGVNFGKATANEDFAIPREVRLSVGIRF